jgi:hypothetical protein
MCDYRCSTAHNLSQKVVKESDGTLKSVKLSNEKLVTDILESFDMLSCEPKATPLPLIPWGTRILPSQSQSMKQQQQLLLLQRLWLL